MFVLDGDLDADHRVGVMELMALRAELTIRAALPAPLHHPMMNVLDRMDLDMDANMLVLEGGTSLASLAIAAAIAAKDAGPNMMMPGLMVLVAERNVLGAVAAAHNHRRRNAGEGRQQPSLSHPIHVGLSGQRVTINVPKRKSASACLSSRRSKECYDR